VEKYKKILVITFWGLGDFVLALSAVSLLKKTLPKTQIEVLMLKNFAQFAKNNPVIDKYFFYYHNRNDSFFIDRVKKLLWFIAYFPRILFARYDACIFLDNSVLLTLIVKLAGIKIIAGPNLRANGFNIPEPSVRFYTHIARLNPNSQKLHMSQRYQGIVRSFLGTQNMSKPILPDTLCLKEKALSLLAPQKKFSLCLAYKGGQPLNTLSIDRTIGLLRNINKEIDASFYLLGDFSCAQGSDYIVKTLMPNGISIKNLCSKTDLLTLKAVLENCDLLLSVDTGIMHIAAATGIKIVSLHGGHTWTESTRPMSHQAISLCSYLDCSPCSTAVCPNNLKCLSDISDEEIVEKILFLLEVKNEEKKL
jgi:ADP-heptose:LPS heptosyltransferase